MKRKKAMSRKARDELVLGSALRYAKASRKEKGMILDEHASVLHHTVRLSCRRLPGRFYV